MHTYLGAGPIEFSGIGLAISCSSFRWIAHLDYQGHDPISFFKHMARAGFRGVCVRGAVAPGSKVRGGGGALPCTRIS